MRLTSWMTLLTLLVLHPPTWGAVPYRPAPNTPAYLQFKAYNEPAGFVEHDLWWIEEEYLRRTHPLIAPRFFRVRVWGSLVFA